MMNTPSWIEPFAKSSYQLFINHDPSSHLPFDGWSLHPLYADLWLDKIHQAVVEFNKRGLKIEDHLESFPNLSSTRFIVLVNTIQYKTAKMDNPALITTIQDFLVASIEKRAKEDLFAYNKNIGLSVDEVNELISSRPLNKSSDDESKEIGKILVALAMLTHGLYNDWCTDYNYEISGQYKHRDSTILLRSFPDISPKEIWPEIDWPYKNVSVITAYEDLSAKIAFVGCHILYDGNAVEKLTSYNFQVDGKDIKGLEALKKLRDEMMPKAAEQFERFNTMNFEDQKIKFITQECYQLKKLFDLVEMDWHPTSEMLERIQGKELMDKVFESYDLEFDQYREIFGTNKLIDSYRGV